jgi:hypothetical protein
MRERLDAIMRALPHAAAMLPPARQATGLQGVGKGRALRAALARYDFPSEPESAYDRMKAG